MYIPCLVLSLFLFNNCYNICYTYMLHSRINKAACSEILNFKKYNITLIKLKHMGVGQLEPCDANICEKCLC